MKRINWNKDWIFTKDAGNAGEEKVDLPHTWNGMDGQDGGNDYYRGICHYRKELDLEKLTVGPSEDVYLEFEGANSSAEVLVDRMVIGRHEGGYSTWRICLTPYLKKKSLIQVNVDNRPNHQVYPQMADFTFYGGLYRNVHLITASGTRFDLDHYGDQGLQIDVRTEGADAEVKVSSLLQGLTGDETLELTIWDGDDKAAHLFLESPLMGAPTQVKDVIISEGILKLQNVHLWQGREDPHLYLLQAQLRRGEELLDERSMRFGCRTFKVDPEKGFLLNGKSYPLRGVSRHQDRPQIGNALLPHHHREDMDLICEMGANTIRLAHYQHDSYFYDLCDEKGMIVWAEIPYISAHLPHGTGNAISQLEELIMQNYNHPSIAFWGLSNEITMHGDYRKEILDNHKKLNQLAHKLDAGRLTTVAVVSMCDMNEQYLHVPDVTAYNHYFGWYGGDTSMYGPFLDEFHARFPEKPIGISEYGCEALNWHTSHPEQGDYTEEYQALYHEATIKQLFSREFVWGTYVWNMFDFAADARAEGGEDGMNHKGLVTFDRKYKKDAFYAYKAWLSKEPFVHICGKRYVDRAEELTEVTVYSNQPKVQLFDGQKLLDEMEAFDHFFHFRIPLTGDLELVAVAGLARDESFIRKVDKENEAYRMKETGDVLNWFEITGRDGYFSLNDKVGDLADTPEGTALLLELLGKQVPEGMYSMMSSFSVKRLLGLLGTLGTEKKMTKEEMLELNQRLNTIAKRG